MGADRDDHIAWARWADAVQNTLEAARETLGGRFTMSVKDTMIPIIFKNGDYEQSVGSAEITFSNGRPQASVVIDDITILEQLGVKVTFNTHSFPSAVGVTSRFVLEAWGGDGCESQDSSSASAESFTASEVSA